MKGIGIIVWFGIAFILLNLLNSFTLLFEVIQGIPVAMGGIGFIGIAWFLSIIGAFLMFLGGYFAKPRYLWLFAIILGILHIVSYAEFIPMWLDLGNTIFNLPFVFLTLSPGLILVIGGLIVRLLSYRSKAEVKG